MATILVIDDNEELRTSVEELLLALDYSVVTAENGPSGILLARQHHPNLILCDVMMPDMDGYAVLKELCQSPDTAAIPFVFVSGKASVNDLQNSLHEGASDFLTKPFGIEQLIGMIERYIL